MGECSAAPSDPRCSALRSSRGGGGRGPAVGRHAVGDGRRLRRARPISSAAREAPGGSGPSTEQPSRRLAEIPRGARATSSRRRRRLPEAHGRREQPRGRRRPIHQACAAGDGGGGEGAAGLASLFMPKKKASIVGASSNLVNSIAGAGVIGIRYALLLALVAALTDKSLRFHLKLRHLPIHTFDVMASYPSCSSTCSPWRTAPWSRACLLIMSSLPPRLSSDEIAALLARADDAAYDAQEELEYAEPIAWAAGLTVHSSVLDATYNGSAALASASSAAACGGGSNPTAAELAAAATDLQKEASLAVQARQDFNPLRGTLSAFPLVLSTSGGHSNTDHIIRHNRDGTVEKFSEYKRRMKRRHRITQLEERGSDRWDLPRIPGGRRRRIQRDVDSPSAPPEPPHAGYIIYLSQMTTKITHDNPTRHHNQILAVRKISSMWKVLPQAKRDHYVRLAKDAQEEYQEKLLEHRATGHWSAFTTITRLDNNKNGVVCRTDVELNSGGNGPWVRIPYEAKNELEKEIDTYEQVIFPMRPKGMEQEYKRKMKESQDRRREKIRKETSKGYLKGF